MEKESSYFEIKGELIEGLVHLFGVKCMRRRYILLSRLFN